jgi:hypothetical protein
MLTKNILDTEIWREIQNKGYVIIRNFFPQPELLAYWNAIDLLAEAFAKGIGLHLSEFDDLLPDERDRKFVRIIKNRPDLQPVLYDRLQMIPELLALPSHQRFQKLAQELLKTKSIGVWPRMQVRLDLCGDEKNVIRWHHDYLYNKGTSNSYTFWMPMVSITKEMGTLLLAERSHKLKLRDEIFERVEVNRRFLYNLKEETLKQLEYWQPESFSAGDLVIFHSLLVHSGMLNTMQDRARMTVLFRMQNLEKLEAY